MGETSLFDAGPTPLPGGDPTGRPGRGMGGSHRTVSGTDEWLTPPAILEALGPFDLDPCAPVDRPWPTAARHLTIEDDGLAADWEGLVWLNPPYGRATGQWLSRLAGHPGGGIALIFARTETEMFHDHVWTADALLFLKGRLHFFTVDGQRAAHNAGAPSVLVAYGSTAIARLRSSVIEGVFIDLARNSQRTPAASARPPRRPVGTNQKANHP